MPKHGIQVMKKAPPTKWKPPGGYNRHFLRMAFLVGNARFYVMKPEEVEALTDIDWLGVAIGKLGGIPAAAKIIGVSRQTLYEWVGAGLENVSFGKVAELAKAAEIPLDMLAAQRKPYRPRLHRVR